MTRIKQFSVNQSFDYYALLEEASEIVSSANIELGPLEQLADDGLEAEITPLRKLREAQAFFAPSLTVQRLRKRDFEARQITRSPEIKKWMKSHRFYLLQVPVTLKPSLGWAFTRLECWIGFDNPTVKIHDIYPENSWTEVLKVQTVLNMGLNEGLHFRAALGLSSTELTLEKLSAAGQADLGVDLTVAGGAKFVAGPFTYQVWRPEILAVGRENVEAFWQMDGDEHVQQQEPYLGLVLRVPKDVQSVNATGEMIAYHDYNRLGADKKDWWKKLRPKLKAFFQGGIPLQNQKIWKDILTM